MNKVFEAYIQTITEAQIKGSDKANSVDQLKITKYIRKKLGITGKQNDVYFDDADLVLGDKTVLAGVLAKKSTKTVDDLVAAVKKFANTNNIKLR